MPAGALAADTHISIQPSENTAPGGLGMAYHFEPDGQAFAAPIQLSFAYGQSDLDGTSADVLGIAFQDAGGNWEWQRGATLDASAGRVTVTTDHFSYWTLVPGAQLKPASATARLKGKVALEVVTCVQRRANAVTLGGVVYLGPCENDDGELGELAPVVDAATWSVNGSVRGGGAFGTVTGTQGNATYTAPSSKPPGAARAVAAVSVKVAGGKGTTLLVANIAIDAGYRVVGSYLEKNSNLICAGAITPQIADVIAFTLKPDGSRYVIADIRNAASTFDPPKFPVAVPQASVTLTPGAASKPDVMKVADATVEPSGGGLLDVVADGTNHLGSCTFHGNGTSYVAAGADSNLVVAFSFYENRFSKGSQIGIAGVGSEGWAWLIVEQ